MPKQEIITRDTMQRSHYLSAKSVSIFSETQESLHACVRQKPPDPTCATESKSQQEPDRHRRRANHLEQ